MSTICEVGTYARIVDFSQQPDGLLGIEAHMGEMDAPQCQQVLALVTSHGPGTDYWATWLAGYSGPKVPAPDPSGGPLWAIEDAPGSYVKSRD